MKSKYQISLAQLLYYHVRSSLRRAWAWAINRRCADCGRSLWSDRTEGGCLLEDGRLVCWACLGADFDRIIRYAKWLRATTPVRQEPPDAGAD